MTDERVCWKCFDDDDIVSRIKWEKGPRGCTFCKRRDACTADFAALSEFISERFHQFYGSADDLPYESAEGGYQGVTYSSWDLIEQELELPRDNDNTLLLALADELGDQLWTDYDWASLDDDVLYGYNWKKFCETIKHERRFFFHEHDHDPDDRENLSASDLLRLISGWIATLELIRPVPVGSRFYRARRSKRSAPLTTPSQLGPPPKENALQANRMNPAGIPMMYVSDRRLTALAETPGKILSVGKFETIKPLNVVDLSLLPETPGFFSSASREERLSLKFLHQFRKDIELPVARDNGAHIDYLPSQVVTEYLRRPIQGFEIHGVRYRSVKRPKETNLVFFATQENVDGATSPSQWVASDFWFQMIGHRTVRRPKGI